MSEQRMVTTVRECKARLVPVGTAVTIPADQFVTLTQWLGGNYTVVYQGNMLRVDGVDADALGLEKFELELPPGEEGVISEAQVWAALESVYDPEIPVNLKSLGLIYKLELNQQTGRVTVEMTLTAPGCGMGPVLVGDVKNRISLVPNVKSVEVDLVFDPPWDRSMMSEEAQLETGMFF